MWLTTVESGRYALGMLLAAALAVAALQSDADLNEKARFGSVISGDSILRCSSTSPWDEPEFHLSLLGPGHDPFAFHTAEEDRPWVQIDLGRARQVTGIAIANRSDGNGGRTRGLAISISTDAIAWNEVASVSGPKADWSVSLLEGDRPREARYVRITLSERGYLHLNRVRVYGRGGAG